ncbi:MAG: PqqD family protein [Phycisphaerae bacterium]
MKKRVQVEREDLMGAVVVRNSLVKEVSRREGCLRLSAPVVSRGLRWLLKSGREKVFELDALGMWVWDRVAGRVTVGELVEGFAGAQGVEHGEAEGRVVGCLQGLLQRTLVTLVRK